MVVSRKSLWRLAVAAVLAVPVVANNVAQAAPPSGSTLTGLAGYWSFDDSVNFNVPDVGGSTLTKENGASWSANGKFGGALSLNGASQTLADMSSPSWLPVGNSSYTQSVWFKPSVVNNGGLMGWGNYGSTKRTNALRMSGSGSGGFYNYWWDVDLYCSDSACPLTANNWYHVVTTYDGTDRKLYLNGVLKASDSGRGPNNATAADFHIGRTCCSEYFTGLIDDVAIYNRALSSAEVSALATATTTTTTTTTSTTTTSTTTTTIAPTTTVAPTTTAVASATTAAPALQINISAPVTTAVGTATTVVGSTASTTAPVLRSVAPAATAAASVPTTTTTTLPEGTTTTLPPAPQVANLGVGEAAVQVAGEDVATTLTRENNQVILRAGDVTAALSALDEAGQTAPLDAGGNIRLLPGSSIRVNIAGFQPDSTVDAWMFSTPYHLGTAKVDLKGAVSTDFTVPADIDKGKHRIAIDATLPNGEKTTVALAVSVGGYDKESNIGTWLIVTPIVLAVLVALFIPAARRRRSATA